ncbi:predicted protein [Sclerotinia sclerotiorum 1980 UF-70]|uniref:Uncharacterized protein n=1 Tax=Sclerotinia sclerotiorum (strain ATCC 18683 / 1980 / Ss-1) TaxID=665079 RepID=A7F000_SCLS1|nr:predicted protein [Sclerotinia sclerotiorum 1980 UF-70]EDN95042.1 predicted protein [Sclerotinia sclerotiorum 1980 UF-70]
MAATQPHVITAYFCPDYMQSDRGKRRVLIEPSQVDGSIGN